MKKLLCFILSVCLLVSATVLSVSATEGDPEEAYAAPAFYGVQFASGSAAGTQNIRFVSVVPNGNGTAVGYEIFAKYTDGTEKYVEYSVSKNDTVMETNQLYAEVKSGNFGSKTATELGDELNMTSPYGLMAIAINGVPSNQEIRFYVRTYVKEGDEVKAEAIFTGFVVNGATAETISASDEWHNQGGVGTADYPYVLTQANFEAFYTHYKYGGSNAFAADQHFSLETDVTLNAGSAADWETAAPNGVKCNFPMAEFKGVLDGNGHTVSGVYVKSTGRAALFYQMATTATVKNLRVVNSYFEVDNTGYGAAASIAGRLVGGTIENCYSDAIIKCKNATTNSSLGGFVGMTNRAGSAVSNCVFAGEIEGLSVSGAGGIVGKNNSGTDKINGTDVGRCVEITNCLNLGSVKAAVTGAILGKDDRVISATSTSVIRNCVNLSDRIVKVDTDNGGVPILYLYLYGGGMTGLTVETVVVKEFATAYGDNCEGIAHSADAATVGNISATYKSFAELTSVDLPGWFFAKGCVPSPIKGLEIDSAPILEKITFDIPAGQYNSYIGKGLELEAKGELIEDLSHDQILSSEDYYYRYAQGGCTDGTYYYYFLTAATTDVTPEKCVLLKFDIANQKLVAKSEEMELHHANAAVYNPNTKKIVVPHGNETDRHFYSVIDPVTLEVESTEVLNYYGAIAYDATQQLYILADGKSNRIDFYDHDFNLVKRMYIAKHLTDYNVSSCNQAPQGMTCDGEFIYFLEYWQNGNNSADIRCNVNVYDIDTGRLIQKIPVEMKRETENIVIWNNDFYIVCNNRLWRGAECYRVSIGPKTAS